jgi:6,7-dimethyl-8-ribityllumazine synthase
VSSGGFWPGEHSAPQNAGDAEEAAEIERPFSPNGGERGSAAEPDSASAAERTAVDADEDTGDQEAVAEPVAEDERAAEPEPVLEAEPALEAEPVVEVEPAVEAEPAVEVESAPEPESELRPAGHAPGELRLPDGVSTLEGSPTGAGRSVGIVVSRFNGDVTNRLLDSALAELDRAGVEREHVTIVPVPGAFELPLAAMGLAKTRRYACIVALGCVIRGETAHFDYVAGEAASGLQLAGLETGVPVAFGLLTVDTLEQAMARVDKGREAVQTALEMADLFSQVRAQARS